MQVITEENPEDGGIIGVKSENMSCVCSRRNCHCSDLDHIEEVEFLAESDVAVSDQVSISLDEDDMIVTVNDGYIQSCGPKCYIVTCVVVVLISLASSALFLYGYRMYRLRLEYKYQVSLSCSASSPSLLLVTIATTYIVSLTIIPSISPSVCIL